MTRIKDERQQGSALVALLLIMTIALIAVASTLSMNQSELRTVSAVKKRSAEYYAAESAFNKTVAWMQSNSKNLMSPFLAGNFYDQFYLDNSLLPGSNDDGAVPVPARLKSSSDNSKSIILVNGEEGSTAYYPSTENLETSAAFFPASAFSSADLGGATVRVTLVNAVPDVESEDPGQGASEDPETDFRPVFRIDAMTNADKGTHVYGYVTTELVTSPNGCVCDCSDYSSSNSGSSGSSSSSGSSGSSSNSGSSGSSSCSGASGSSSNSGSSGSSSNSGSSGSNSGSSGSSSSSGSSGSGKITICHIPPGNPDNAHTISVSNNAWPAHEAHGDSQGACSSSSGSSGPSNPPVGEECSDCSAKCASEESEGDPGSGASGNSSSSGSSNSSSNSGSSGSSNSSSSSGSSGASMAAAQIPV